MHLRNCCEVWQQSLGCVLREEFIESIGVLEKTLAPQKEVGVEVTPLFGVKSNPTDEFERFFWSTPGIV